MNFISKKTILERLRRGRKVRERFVESHLAKGLAYQIRATRDERGWTQEELAGKLGTTQNAIYRLESPDYGKQTLTTLKRLAAVFDVGLIVRFVPFSEMTDWVSGTPRIDRGMASKVFVVPDFVTEEADDSESARGQRLEDSGVVFSAGVDAANADGNIAGDSQRSNVLYTQRFNDGMNPRPEPLGRQAPSQGIDERSLEEMYGRAN